MYRSCMLLKWRGRTAAAATSVSPMAAVSSDSFRYFYTVAAAAFLLIQPLHTTSSLTLFGLPKRARTEASATGISAEAANKQRKFFSTTSTTIRMSTTTTTPTTVNDDDDDVASEKTVVKNMLHRIRQVNYMPDDIRKTSINFFVDGIHVGKVRPKTAEMLCNTRIRSGSDSHAVFALVNSNDSVVSNDDKPHYLTLTSDAGRDFESRSQSVAKVMEQLRDQEIVRGWRDELYPVSNGFYNPPLFAVERAAAPLLGILEYGVHINGIVNNSEHEPMMWIARRSKQKSKYPGMLDHIVAGGQPVGISLMDNVIKECFEEAGIPESMTRHGIQSAGAISYEHYSGPQKETIARAVFFCYDLLLPESFQPKPMDGEVDSFFLWTMDDIKKSMAPDFDDPIKPNCYIVIIDYLLRKGCISPDTPGYLDILRELRSGNCC